MLTTQAVLTFEGKLNHEMLVAAISPLLDDEKTKVKLTAVELLALLHASLGAGTLLPCFTGTKVQILTQRSSCLRSSTPLGAGLFNLLALLVQKYEYWLSCLRFSTPRWRSSVC